MTIRSCSKGAAQIAKFMVILHQRPGEWQQLSPEEMRRKVEKYQAANGKRFATPAGTLPARSSARKVARSLNLQGGKVQVVDGPYMEAKEVVGGYFLFRAPTTPRPSS